MRIRFDPTQQKMTKAIRRILLPVILAALAVLASLTACISAGKSKGLEQIVDLSYETVTNKLSAYQPNPVAAGVSSFSGPWHVAGQHSEFEVDEGPQEDLSGTYTMIVVTGIDAKSTRLQIKTTKLGLLFDTRDRKIEKQRLSELSGLLLKRS